MLFRRNFSTNPSKPQVGPVTSQPNSKIGLLPYAIVCLSTAVALAPINKVVNAFKPRYAECQESN